MKPPRIALPRLRLPRPQLRLRLPAPASARHARLPPASGPMRLLRPWHWALAGMLSGLLLTSILFAPARWLASAVAYASNEQLQLQDASGTVWNGSAWLVLTGGSQSRDATTLPSRLQWQLRPRLTGARVTLESDCCTRQPLQLDLDWQAGGMLLRLADGEIALPSSLLAGLGTPWNTLQLDGRLSARSSRLQIRQVHGRSQLSGTLDIRLDQATTRLSTLSPIGSYQLRLLGGAPDSAGKPQLTLDSEPGSSLLLQGQGEWVDGKLRFRGEARADAGKEEALNNLINIIGRRRGDRSVLTVG